MKCDKNYCFLYNEAGLLGIKHIEHTINRKDIVGFSIEKSEICNKRCSPYFYVNLILQNEIKLPVPKRFFYYSNTSSIQRNYQKAQKYAESILNGEIID